MAKIMVISQDLELIGTITASLRKEGHDVVACTKPADVPSGVRRKDLDIVFIDVHMRDIRQEKVADVVRRMAPDAQIVTITSYAFPYVSACDEGFVTSYLVQPLTDDKIRNVANRVLRQQRAFRETRRLLSNVTTAKQQWEALVDAIDDPIFLTDLDHNVLRANLATYRSLGKGVEKVLSGKCYEVFHCMDNPPPDCPGKRARASGTMVSDIVHFEGFKDRLSCDIYPQVFAGGGLVHHLYTPAVGYETQTDLMTTYERIFDESLVPILLVDVEDYTIVDANRRAFDFLVREPGMIFNMKVANLFVPAIAERAMQSLAERIVNGGGSFRSRIVDGRGREKDVYIVVNGVTVRNRPFASVMVISVELL